MTKREIEKLRKELPNGYAKIIADKFKVTCAYVYAIVAGKRTNNEILNELISLANENKMIIEKNKQALKSL